MAFPSGERVWITDAQRVTIDTLGIIAAVDAELSKRAAAGEKITQAHYWAYLAEEVTRNIQPGSHYLRNAYDAAHPIPSQRGSTD